MAYTAEKPRLTPSSEELRERVPNWGVDLDPSDRPGVPREQFNPGATGAHWDFPERQPELTPRERSNEHKFLTPVFGTSCPLKGVSGAIRRYAYRYSEGRAAHWLLLMAGDRVDVIESRIGALLRGTPDNPWRESGLASEFTRHGRESRVGRNRADLTHQPVDLLLFASTWIAAAGVAYALNRAFSSGGRRVR
jgi:hypothetical protein